MLKGIPGCGALVVPIAGLKCRGKSQAHTVRQQTLIEVVP